MKIVSIRPLQKPIRAVLAVPGSKSYTNRSLLLAVLGEKSVRIIHPLISDDTKALTDCLERLGIKISKENDCFKVENDINSIKDGIYDLDTRLSGTTIRFLLALSTVIAGVKTLYGMDGLNKRPIGDLVEGLRQLGAKIEYPEKKGYPPVKILSSKLNPGTIKIKGSISSQYISAILMIAPVVGKISIEIIGNQVSKPYIDMTIDIMKQFGVMVFNENYKRYRVPGGQKYNLSEYSVEGDYSSASYFFAIAALTKSVLTAKNLNPDSMQADKRFLNILEKMGNKIISGENQITLIGRGVKPVSVDMKSCPDQIQTLAVLAAFAKGKTSISGISTLRLKETDRVAALKKELKKMGIKTSATEDVLTIFGGDPKSAKIDTYGDHRMAMSFAVAGCKLEGVKILDGDVVNKTFPKFWQKLNSIGVETLPVDTKNIVLIGMRGSGKSTVGKLLSQKLKKEYLDTDSIIVKNTGLSIHHIVKKYGWEYFRDKESEITQELSMQVSKIVSTGGGVVERIHNINALKKNGLLIYLWASEKTILKRGYNDKKRPALTDKKTIQEEIADLLKKRQKLYEGAADFIINTDKLNVQEAADKICKIIS